MKSIEQEKVKIELFPGVIGETDQPEKQMEYESGLIAILDNHDLSTGIPRYAIQIYGNEKPDDEVVVFKIPPDANMFEGIEAMAKGKSNKFTMSAYEFKMPYKIVKKLTGHDNLIYLRPAEQIPDGTLIYDCNKIDDDI